MVFKLVVRPGIFPTESPDVGSIKAAKGSSTKGFETLFVESRKENELDDTELFSIKLKELLEVSLLADELINEKELSTRVSVPIKPKALSELEAGGCNETTSKSKYDNKIKKYFPKNRIQSSREQLARSNLKTYPRLLQRVEIHSY